MLAQWSRLKSAMVAWRHKLGQSQSMQHFKREADEAAAWMAEKMQIACDDSYKDPTNLSVRVIHSTGNVYSYYLLPHFFIVQGKLQKHQAFEAEVIANKDRIFATISMGQSK